MFSWFSLLREYVYQQQFQAQLADEKRIVATELTPSNRSG